MCGHYAGMSGSGRVVMNDRWLAVAAVLVLMSEGCALPPAPTPVATAPPPAPVAFDQAVANAGNAVLTAAAAGGGRMTLVIDPLVNGVTGEQSASTKALGVRLAELARDKYPTIQVLPFTAESAAAANLVMVGTFTPVNAQNAPAGVREAYRFCLVVADLKSGKTLAKSVARATLGGVDSTPTKSFADSPAWTEDANVKAYINTCQATKVGDPIPVAYVNGLVTAAMVNQAMEAYDSAKYPQALDIYTNARATPAGDQMRIYNGLYLTRSRLQQREQAAAAFGDVVDYGLRNNRLAVKLLFRTGSTALATDSPAAAPYSMWLQQIASRSAKAGACLQVTGHTSASGSPVLNERLSVLRAEYVKGRLEQDDAGLRNKVVAAGAGSQQVLVGTGSDNAADSLDRRVEFKIIPAC